SADGTRGDAFVLAAFSASNSWPASSFHSGYFLGRGLGATISPPARRQLFLGRQSQAQSGCSITLECALGNSTLPDSTAQRKLHLQSMRGEGRCHGSPPPSRLGPAALRIPQQERSRDSRTSRGHC